MFGYKLAPTGGSVKGWRRLGWTLVLVPWKVEPQLYGDSSTKVADAYNNLGNNKLRQAQYAQAEEYYVRAAGIYQESKGLNSPELAFVVSNLGVAYENIGKYKEAENVRKHVLSVYEKAYGPDDSRVADAVSKLGDIILGSDSAPVTIVEYASMTCGHCADFSVHTLPQIKERVGAEQLAQVDARLFELGGTYPVSPSVFLQGGAPGAAAHRRGETRAAPGASAEGRR